VKYAIYKDEINAGVDNGNLFEYSFFHK